MKANGVFKNLLFVLNVVLALALSYSILHAHLAGLVLSVIALVLVVGLQVWVMRRNGASDSTGQRERVKK